jgi:cyanophycinase
MKLPFFLIFPIVLMGVLSCEPTKTPTEAKPQEVKSVFKPDASKGKLFIIGGGERCDSLTTRMIDLAGFKEGEYAVMIPIASGGPDSSYAAFMREWEIVSKIPCYNFNLSEADNVNRSKIDSLSKARLIFFGGGDQLKIMAVMKDSPLLEAVRTAHKNGAMIAGTSAGAAIMSKVMITGDQNFSEEYRSTYDKIWKDNGIYNTGAAFLDSTIIDQHFVIRSRYNRLLSALCDFPGYMGVGIDESTALFVQEDHAMVVGASQVICFQPITKFRQNLHHLGFRDVKMDIYLAGDVFELK